MGQPSRQGSALFSVRLELWRSTGFEIVAGRGTPLPSTEDCSRHNDRWKCKPGQVSWRLVAIPIDTNG